MSLRFDEWLEAFSARCVCAPWQNLNVFHSLFLCYESQKPPNHCLRRRVKNVNLHARLMCLKQIAICTCFDVTYVRSKAIFRLNFPKRWSFSWKEKKKIAYRMSICLVQMHLKKSLNFIDLWNERRPSPPQDRQTGNTLISRHGSHRLGFRFFAHFPSLWRILHLNTHFDKLCFLFDKLRFLFATGQAITLADVYVNYSQIVSYNWNILIMLVSLTRRFQWLGTWWFRWFFCISKFVTNNFICYELLMNCQRIVNELLLDCYFKRYFSIDCV